MKYAIIVDAWDGKFESTVPDFPWCSYTCQTADEALQETVDALELHLTGLVEDGDPIPSPTATISDVQVQVPTAMDPSGSTTYRVVIERAPQNLSAFVPDLPGCISVGRTMDEMLAMIKEAMEGHIELMVEDGDPIPPKTSIVDMFEIEATPTTRDIAEVAD